MTAPSPLPFPPSSREAELSRTEAGLATHEARLAEQLSRAAAEAELVSLRLAELRQEVTRVSAERLGDAEVRGAGARLESASAHVGALDRERERAVAARQEALRARQRALQEAQAALEALKQLQTRAKQELAETEAGLKRSAEAAAAARARQVAAKPPARPVAPVAAPRASRVRMQASIDLRSDSNFFTGFSTDVSEGGIFVATVRTVPRGTQVDLDLTLPGGRPMRVNGVVRWTREVNDKTPELMPGLGVQFTSLPPEVAAAISDFVATREPLFFPD